MKGKELVALIALVLGVVGGLLLLVDFVEALPRLLEHANIGVKSLLLVVIGIIAIIASANIWKGKYLVGGLLNIIFGIAAVIYGKDSEGLIILISGVLGIIAPKVKD
jgi:hypothetical protein